VTRRTARPAFTLVELLVVMAMIATLAAVTIGATFRVQAAQRKSATEATLTKIDSLLQQKLKTIQEQINEDARLNKPNSGYPELIANGYSPDIAKAILMYSRTKNQLPMTFAEATTDFTIPGTSIVLKHSPIFNGLAGPGTNPEESAICLYLVLSQLGNSGLEQQIGDAPSFPGRKCYIDTYGQPIYFNRLAYGGDAGIELDNPPFVRSGAQHDPFYPKQVDSVYKNLGTDLGAANIVAFWNAMRANTPGWAGIPTAYPGLKNHVTTAISAGADKDFIGAGLYSGDNIVSYRLRKDGEKGD
jgi:prepilin-type N-terminal cleavage/methylation domain-containing protein